MKKRIKNPAAVALGRAGGSVKSEAKRLAAKRNAEKRWAMQALKDIAASMAAKKD